MSSEKDSVRVWDLPLRLFHWLLVILVSVSIYTGLSGGFKEMDYHMLSGYCILGLVIFRLAWGFFGSVHSRFSSFIKPAEILPYLKSLIRGEHRPSIGHNPLGALSVLAMLLVLGIQATTGLFANDDIMLEGPLTHLVSDETSDELTGVHHLNAWLLFILIGLHILAIVFYEVVKKERLILPMITGKKSSTTGDPVVNPVKEISVAIVLGLIAGGLTYYIVTLL